MLFILSFNRQDLQSRYINAATWRLLIVSTYLDPRYKELPFLAERVKQQMTDEVEDKLLSMETTQDSLTQDTQDSQLPLKVHPPKGLSRVQVQFLNFRRFV